MERILVFITSLIIAFNSISSQGNSSVIDMNTINQVATRMMKSPEVASMGRYGEYPVDLCTGVPDITIPIYTIQSGTLEYPISLSYHLGGIKVDDIASWVGLGWTLKANGSISRTIRGIADEDINGGFLHKKQWSFIEYDNGILTDYYPFDQSVFWRIPDDATNFENFQTYFEKMLYGIYDGQSDIYNYQVNNISGSFVYNLKREIIQKPYTDNKIRRDTGNNFTIISDDGKQYRFQAKDTDNVVTLSGGETRFNTGISSWLLSEIISDDFSDTIKFTYTNPQKYIEYQDGFVLTKGLVHRRLGSSRDYTDQNQSQLDYTGGSVSTSHERILQAIEFKSGRIEFATQGDRLDKRKYKLSHITIKDNNGKQIRKIKFNYNYFLSYNTPSKTEDYRLKLESINIFGTNDSYSQLYTFTYNEREKLPPYFAGAADQSRRSHNKGQDHWGYYNGVTTNQTLIGVLPPELQSWGHSNRRPSEGHMKACILERIDYPTGGYTIFETEANRYPDNMRLMQIVGGLRVSKIRSSTNYTNNPEIVTTYVYDRAKFIFQPKQEHYRYITFNLPFTRYAMGDISEEMLFRAYTTYYTESPLTPIGYHSGSPVVYQKVTKYEGDFIQSSGPAPLKSSVIKSKTVYTYNHPVLYASLTAGNNMVEEGLPGSRVEFVEEPVTWKNGKVQKEEVFKADYQLESDSYKYEKIKEINYSYSDYTTIERTGKIVFNRFNYQDLFSDYPNYNTINKTFGIKKFFDYHVSTTLTGYEKLTKTKEITYDSSRDSSILITEYKYGNTMLETDRRNYLITEKTILQQNNDVLLQTKYFYPHNSSAFPCKVMVKRNMISSPIEEISFNKSKEISRKKLIYKLFPEPPSEDEEYAFDSNYKVRPSLVQSSATGETSLRTDIVYDKYSPYGNLIQQTTIDGITTVFLWSYNNQYPIAEIRNATYEQISQTLSPFEIDRISKLKYPLTSDIKNLNRLRYLLSEAEISTYTYKPLVGVETSTSPSGFTTYYGYDIFNRLRKTFFYENGRKINLNFLHYNYTSTRMPIDSGADTEPNRLD